MGSLTTPPTRPTLTRSARTANVQLTAADLGTFIDVTSGTFVQTTALSAALGSGWEIDYRNSGTGIVTYTPGNGTIDGRASIRIYPGESFTIQCDGTNQNSVGRKRKGDLVLINETIIAAPAANVDFTLGFDDTELADMFFRFAGLTADNGTLRCRASIAGVFQNAGYTRDGWLANSTSGASPTGQYSTALTQADMIDGGAALATGAGELEIRDFASTTTAKLLATRYGAMDGAAALSAGGQIGCLVASTAAIDGFRFYSNSGNVNAGTIQQLGRRQ